MSWCGSERFAASRAEKAPVIWCACDCRWSFTMYVPGSSTIFSWKHGESSSCRRAGITINDLPGIGEDIASYLWIARTGGVTMRSLSM